MDHRDPKSLILGAQIASLKLISHFALGLLYGWQRSVML